MSPYAAKVPLAGPPTRCIIAGMSKDSPHDLLAQVEQSVREFTSAEGALAETKRRLDIAQQDVLEQVRRLRDTVEAVHAPLLIGLLRHLYWQQPGIHSRALAEAAGLTLNDMLAAIGPCPSGIFCAACGAELLRTSRSWSPTRRSNVPLCEQCAAQKQQDSSRQWHVQQLRARIVAEAAVRASARDWHAATELVLAYPPLSPKAARGSSLDQQAGIWRGWENARALRDRLVDMAVTADAIVDVPAAHAKLLISTALVVSDWDSARTRDILDPITHEPALALLTRLNISLRDTTQAAEQRAAAAYPDGYEPGAEEVEALWSGTP
ncbi:hypothetical protein SHL15_5609 [Streptomyces hygroscopicus subsp. limoneus]|nr:hypothetical protein SHL15_5609 [Streptomyces hygroscopicus subsp. limoneus]